MLFISTAPSITRRGRKKVSFTMYSAVSTRIQRGKGGVHHLLRLKQRYLGVAFLTGFLHVTSVAGFHPVSPTAAWWGLGVGGQLSTPFPFGSSQGRAAHYTRYSTINNHRILSVQDPGAFRIIHHQQRCCTQLFMSQSFDSETENSSSTWEEGNGNDDFKYDDD